MTKKELTERLEDIEWEDFEVKEAKRRLPGSVWDTVSAFANTAGGWLVFGIKEFEKRFKIIGIENAEKTEQDFIAAIRGTKFNVPINIKSEKYNFDGKIVLAFYIPLSDRKPVYFNNPKNTYIRSGSGDRHATQEEIDAMHRQNSFGTMTSKAVPESSSDWLNPQTVAQYRDYMSRYNPNHRYNRFQNEQFLQKIRATSEGKVTYSGLLFFGKEDYILKVFPDFRIDYLEIPGTGYRNAKNRYTFRLEEQENLWDYYFAIFTKLKVHVTTPYNITSEGFGQEISPQLEALREALVNMLMHADYFSTAKSRIRVFTNRIEFFNPGSPPKPLKVLMESDISMPRNPVIAKMFRIVKLAENAGYGFDKMFSGWENYIGASPEFDFNFDSTKATFLFSVQENQPENTSKLPEIDQKQPESNQKATRKQPVKQLKGVSFSDIDLQIIEILRKEPKTSRRKLAEQIDGVSNYSIKHYVEKLKGLGAIVHEGPDKGGYWKVLV